MFLVPTSLVLLLLTAGPVTGVLTFFSDNFSGLLSSPGKLLAVIFHHFCYTSSPVFIDDPEVRMATGEATGR